MGEAGHEGLVDFTVLDDLGGFAVVLFFELALVEDVVCARHDGAEMELKEVDARGRGKR